MRLSYAVSLQKTGFESVGQGDWQTTAQYMGQVGFDGIELAIKDPLKVNMTDLEEVLSQTGLRIAAIGTGQAYFDDGFSLIADDLQVRSGTVTLLKNHIDLAEKFGALVIIGLIRGKLKEQCDRDKAYSCFVENMIELDDYALQKGVDMAVEPVNRYEADYLNTVADTVDLIEANKLKHTGILLDTFHMNIEEAVWQRSVSMCILPTVTVYIQVVDT